MYAFQLIRAILDTVFDRYFIPTACRVGPASIRLASGRRVPYSRIDDWDLVWRQGNRYRVRIRYHPDRVSYATMGKRQYILWTLMLR